jgi:7,8-dihydropterin-6-yl-methyl-4-(beta-D-ribofuranosyl)aminobenzene 5'-phosphate synthase
MHSHHFRIAALVWLLGAIATRATAEPARVTNLYDAFGSAASLKKDWGFAALIEYRGKRILFDTGNNAAIFAHNVKALGVDLRKLDAVVISHRHGDHTSGLSHLLEVNPDVTIYTPVEGAFFKSVLPEAFLKRQPGLPADLEYFGGQSPARLMSGTPWEAGRFEAVADHKEIFPGFYVISTQSRKPGTMEMNELSLAVSTPRGLAVIVGCSHPGIDKILAAAARIDAKLYTAIGGFHLVLAPEPEVRRVASVLHDTLHLQRVAPAHCTSELGFATFMDRFKERYDRAGLGAVIALPE